MRADLVQVIEACYRPASSDHVWLRRVLRAVQPVLRPGTGVLGHFFDVADPFHPRAWGAARSGAVDAGWSETMYGMFSSLPPPLIDQVYRRPRPGITASQLVGPAAWKQNPQRREWLPRGIQDSIGVVCTDVTQRGCVLMTTLPRITTVPRRQTMQLRRLAVHVAAGLRLRRGARASTDGEAILHPDGRVAHAESAAKPAAAREALRVFARTVDRARAKLRSSDPDQALRMWEGLAAGRWSLVDHFDTDGRRYLVAHRNDPELAAPNALTQGERQVAGYAAMGHANKFIAYELGLSASTVSTHLGSAMLKLGVRSRAELARLFGAMVT